MQAPPNTSVLSNRTRKYDIVISKTHQTICRRLSGIHRNYNFKLDSALLRMWLDKQPQHPKKPDSHSHSHSHSHSYSHSHSHSHSYSHSYSHSHSHSRHDASDSYNCL